MEKYFDVAETSSSLSFLTLKSTAAAATLDASVVSTSVSSGSGMVSWMPSFVRVMAVCHALSSTSVQRNIFFRRRKLRGYRMCLMNGRNCCWYWNDASLLCSSYRLDGFFMFSNADDLFLFIVRCNSRVSYPYPRTFIFVVRNFVFSALNLIPASLDACRTSLSARMHCG